MNNSANIFDAFSGELRLNIAYYCVIRLTRAMLRSLESLSGYGV